jgi:hypothetical protein
MKKKNLDPAIVDARKTKDEDFKSGSQFFRFMCESTTKDFGRNKMLSGRHKKRK